MSFLIPELEVVAAQVSGLQQLKADHLDNTVQGGPFVHSQKSSKYKGVSWHKHSQKWYAYIQYNGKMHGLGYFHEQEDAAAAYDAEAIRVTYNYQKIHCKSPIVLPAFISDLTGPAHTHVSSIMIQDQNLIV